MNTKKIKEIGKWMMVAGGTDKMIGVPTSEDDRCIYPDSDVEFDDVLPFTE